MIRTAGSVGEGGGRILRTSVSLSLAAGAAAPASDGGIGCRRSGRHPRVYGPDLFLARTFLPLLERMGPTVRLQFERYGFYPAGGGRFRAGIGTAAAAVRDARQYLVSQAAAGEHLTDQLPFALGLAGAGPFTVEKINLHARTNTTVVSGQSAFRGSRWGRGCLSSQLDEWLPGRDSNHEKTRLCRLCNLQDPGRPRLPCWTRNPLIGTTSVQLGTMAPHGGPSCRADQSLRGE